MEDQRELTGGPPAFSLRPLPGPCSPQGARALMVTGLRAELAPLPQAIPGTSFRKFSGGLRPVLGMGRGDPVEKHLLLTARSSHAFRSPAGAGSRAGPWDSGRAARAAPPSEADGLRTTAGVSPSLPWERPSRRSEAGKGGVEAA